MHLLPYFYLLCINYSFADGWLDKTNRKKLLEEYAKANMFDPLDLEKWNSQSVNKILSFKVNFLLLNIFSFLRSGH